MARGLHIVMTVNAAWNLLNFRRGLVAALLRDGHRVTVLAPQDDTCAELAAMGCALVPLAMDRKGMSPLNDLWLMLRFWRVFGRLKPDLVLSFTIKNNIYGALAARLRGIAFIPNVTGLGTAFLSGGRVQLLVERLYRLAFSRVPVVFFQNGDDRDLFESRRLVQPRQVRLLPGSGIDLARFQAAAPTGNPAEAPLFLMIARILRDKGAEEFVAAARRTKARYPQARFVLLGPEGAENRSAIDAQTLAAWRAEGCVELPGAAQDVRPHIAAADCVVLPSYREGMPRTLLEAAAMARPVIASDVPGCRDALEAGTTGLLCRVRDADSLADAFDAFVAMPLAARHAMGRQGRERIERLFDEGLVIDAYRQAIADTEASGCATR